MSISLTITNDGADGTLKLYIDSVPHGVSTAGMEVAPGTTETVMSDFPLRGSINAPETANWSMTVENNLDITPIRLSAESAGSDVPWSVFGSDGSDLGMQARPAIGPGEHAVAILSGPVYLFMMADAPVVVMGNQQA